MNRKDIVEPKVATLINAGTCHVMPADNVSNEELTSLLIDGMVDQILANSKPLDFIDVVDKFEQFCDEIEIKLQQEFDKKSEDDRLFMRIAAAAKQEPKMLRGIKPSIHKSTYKETLENWNTIVDKLK